MTGNAPRFALPGTWGRINLASPATTQTSIRKVVEHAIGRDDRLATVRAEMRSRFLEAATVAREHDATDFHIALELAPGIPMPAWVSVFVPDIDATDFQALGLTDLKEALNFGLATAQSDVATSQTTVPQTRVHAVRQAFRTVQAATEEAPELELLRADYWLAAPNPNRLALLSFTTGYVQFESEMLELFDAVISTVRWPAPAPVPA
ncbi:hypothetical protein [Conyzicola sp.]|uniref:hypothetical protein n=1 Tax=Conyzicola sp. TaxID=1969404 RepID=UPI00398A23EF